MLHRCRDLRRLRPGQLVAERRAEDVDHGLPGRHPGRQRDARRPPKPERSRRDRCRESERLRDPRRQRIRPHPAKDAVTAGPGAFQGVGGNGFRGADGGRGDDGAPGMCDDRGGLGGKGGTSVAGRTGGAGGDGAFPLTRKSFVYATAGSPGRSERPAARPETPRIPASLVATARTGAMGGQGQGGTQQERLPSAPPSSG